MRELPKYQLDPKMKNVWRINDTLSLFLIFLLLFVPFLIAWVFEGQSEAWLGIVLIIIAALFVLGLVFFLAILPPIRFMRWRYELFDTYLDIAHGIIWKKRIIIPFIRVQNTDTRQGPIMRAFGLSSVTVSTAAGEHVIPGLDVSVADALRDKAAELARIAQEDV